jgi:hypothetical protein
MSTEHLRQAREAALAAGRGRRVRARDRMAAYAGTFAKQRARVRSGEWRPMALPLIDKVEGEARRRRSS